jgi:transposase
MTKQSTTQRTELARVCADPFHIIQLANAATDEVRRAAWNSTRRAAGVARPGPLARVRQDPAAQLVKNTPRPSCRMRRNLRHEPALVFPGFKIAQ